MSTIINANRGGTSTGQNSTFNTCRQTAASATDGNFNNSQAISYIFSAGRGRGGGTHQITRSFFHFDVSAITGTVSSLTLNIVGATNTSSDLIVLKSTAFGGRWRNSFIN